MLDGNVPCLVRMKTVLLQSHGFLGDETVFTGVVRELKTETGWNIRIDTGRPQLWQENPYIDGFGVAGNEDVVLNKNCTPGYHSACQTPSHFLELWLRNVRDQLNLPGNHRIKKFAGEVRPTKEEIESPPFALPSRYWIIVAGWKGGASTKAWPIPRYQEVVDSLRGRVAFVQVGERESWHPPLRGVVNLVGKTSLRQLISLVYHAEGVICPITSIMHLAAAIPASTRSGFSLRPCVVVAGGREPSHYIAYPTHQIMSVVGQLDCCASSACGKGRFGPGQCQYPITEGGRIAPRCMTLIKPAEVVAAIESYYRGMVNLPRRLTKAEALLERMQQYGHTSSCIKCAEVGCGRGEVSAQLLRGEQRLHLTMVNCLPNESRSAKDQALRGQQLTKEKEAEDTTAFASSRRHVVSATMMDAIAGFPKASVDFVFVWGDAIANTTEAHLQLWMDRIKPGGYLCGQGAIPDQREPFGDCVSAVAAQNRIGLMRAQGNTWFMRMEVSRLKLA